MRTPPDPTSSAERGVALVLALIFSILLYILVAELVVSGRMVRATGENDAMLARMRTQMLFHLDETEDQLLQDLAGAAAEEGSGSEGAGALAGAMAGAAAGGASGAAGGEGGEEAPEDPSTKCDGSRDSWFEPVGHADNDLTTYVWVEDENRKLNLLALWSPDEKFAEFSRDRLVRLLDVLREDTDFDLSSSDAQRIVNDILEWGRRSGTEQMPRPRLKSENPQRRELVPPVHLDELMLLPSVTEDLFYDKVLDGKVYLGLESVLTIWTSLRVDPGDPEKQARLRAAAEARGEKVTEPAAGAGQNPTGAGAPDARTGGSSGGSSGGASAAGGAAGRGNAAGEEPPPQPDGLGILVNVNTASRQVLRSLFPPEKIPDRVLDAIIEYRNKIDEEATEAAAKEQSAEAQDFGDLRLGAEQKRKVFVDIADLEQVEEFAKLPDPEVKAAFQAALTTKSEVFSIHVAAMLKRNDERRVYVLRRARSVVLRYDDGADGLIVPLVPFEERVGLRLQPVDMQEEYVDRSLQYSEMDQFAQEDRAWNPFLVDCYLPAHVREQFYQPR
ncbi:MAG: general secretion pathway protein GspK [Planctomycetes bacterium]|nr:general secretion pathway protein GspK [Planctomycetota bacterium]